MYTFKLVFSNLYRNRGRYLLFGLLFLILSAVWLVCLQASHAAERLQIELIEKYGTTAVVEERGIGHSLTKEDYERYFDPSIVDELIYTGYMNTPILCNIAPDRVEDGYVTRFRTMDITVAGYNFSCLYTPFTREANPWKLTRGRLIEADDECILFDDLYEQLIKAGRITGLGDTLLICSYALSYAELAEEKYEGTFHAEHELKIVGTIARENADYIFRVRHAEAGAVGISVEGGVAPVFIITTIAQAERFPVRDDAPNVDVTQALYKPSRHLEAVYRLKSYESFSAFAALPQAYNLSQLPDREDPYVPSLLSATAKYHDAQLYLENFEELIEPLGHVGDNISMINVNLCLLAAALVIILTALNLHSRTYEIGVLRCVGMSRGRITLNLLFEQTIFVLVALGMGTIGGMLAAESLIKRLLDAQYSNYLTGNLAGTAKSACFILGIGLALSAVAALGSLIYIQRFRPLRILRNRN